ncbi:MAG: hypothetical protein MR658_06205 [Campylobacter sp.]|uniref:hypothetical protein n=1 Tax=Campylobacter sp. TaxID=205 RepID=UPI002AA90B37|nr:hypothetical protein [Campylobacter sp.]MCI6178401.1 hypothetical protein [Campylobacter sp.]
MLGIIFFGGYFVLILIFSYFWSVVIYKLAISKKIHFIILAIGLYALWGYYTFWDKRLFIISGFFVTALYFAAFMLFRKDFSKKRVIFSSFVCFFCLWQLEVPQKIVFDIAKKELKTKVMKEVFIENIDENATFLTPSKTRLDCQDKNIACPFFSFKYPIYDIKALTDGKVRTDGKLVARIYGIAYSTSTLTRFLSGFTHTERLRYFVNIGK